MVLNLLLLAGAIVAIVALGWWIRRRQRDIDSYEEREYREPPAIHIPPGGRAGG